MTVPSMQVRPRRLNLVCRAVAVLVLVTFGGLAVVLPKGSRDGQQFGVGDQVSFFFIGVLLAVAVLAFTRVRVRADVRGIWVRNVLGERFFPWALVVAVDLPEGAPWAQLELHDDETVALLALQSNDGDTTVESVLALRNLMNTAEQPPS
jgi:hypothetical protein